MDLEHYRQRDRTAEAARRRRRQAEHERLRRTHRRRRALALGVLVVPVTIAALALKSPGGESDAPTATQPAPETQPATTAAAVEAAGPLRFAEPDTVRGVHVDYATAGDGARMQAIMDAANAEHGLNAIQLDVKDERGRIGIAADVPAAARIGAVNPAYDAEKLVRQAHEHGLYTIARVVAFQDPVLSADGGDVALEKKAGGVWKTSAGFGWIDPTDRRAWKYVIDVALAAADAGFDEVMFDYVRFPTDGDVDAAVYSKPNANKDKTITAFLTEARKALHARDVKVSAAIFGIQATADQGIGQDPTLLKKVLDTICPMVYPSHYGAGSFDIADPESQPYDTVTEALVDWKSRVVGGRARLRPWLQDFTYGHITYGTDQVRDQIAAARDMGTDGYLIWNAVAKYSSGVLTP